MDMDEEDTPGMAREVGGPVSPDLADDAPVALFSTDAGGRFLYVNKRWTELTGISAQDAVGWGWERGLHPDDIAGVVLKWQRSVATGEDLNARLRLVRHDGRTDGVHMHAVATPGGGETSGRSGFVGTLTLLQPDTAVVPVDGAVREQRRLERACRDRDERLTLLLAAIPSAVLIADTDGRVVAVNQNFCDLFEVPSESGRLIGTDCVTLTRPAADLVDDPAGFTDRLELLLRHRVPVMGEEVALADGRVFERSHVPIVDSGRYRGHLWIYNDVTDRRILDAETDGLISAGLVTGSGPITLREPAGDLPDEPEDEWPEPDDSGEAQDRRESARAEHPAGTGHRPARSGPAKVTGPGTAGASARDLRVPLTAIVSYVALLRDGLAGPLNLGQDGLAEVVARNAEHLLRVLDDWLVPWMPPRIPRQDAGRDDTGPRDPP